MLGLFSNYVSLCVILIGTSVAVRPNGRDAEIEELPGLRVSGGHEVNATRSKLDNLVAGSDCYSRGCSKSPLFSDSNIMLGMVMDKLAQSTLLNFVWEGYMTANVSEGCQRHLAQIHKSVSTGEMAALRMVDASAKIPAGFMEGSIVFLGSFDQCISTRYAPVNGTPFEGQYCTVRFAPSSPDAAKIIMSQLGDGTVKPATVVTSLRWDICVPSTCSRRDLEAAIGGSANFAFLKTFLSVEASNCVTSRKDDLTSVQIVALVIFSILGIFILLGTLLDVAKQLYEHFSERLPLTSVLDWLRNTSKVRTALLSFSLVTNLTKLLNTSTGKDSLTAVNGIRFLSMSWVILGHCYFFISPSIIGNLRQSITLAEDFAFQSILNGSISVDSFFFLSGLLVSYVAITELRKSGKINWFLFYFHRIWRLTPGYALMILLFFLLPLFGSGPLWKDTMSPMVDYCYSDWWANLLYINNIYHSNGLCFGHSWYLASDMQFYFLSPIVLIAMYKFPRPGLGLCVGIIMISVVTTAIIGAVNHFPPTALFFATDTGGLDFTWKVYIAPWCRWGPYGVGLAVGYFLAVKRNVSIPLLVQVTCWCMAIACNVSVLYGVYSWNKGEKHSQGVNSFYLATHRTAWALGLAWVTYACSTGHGGIVNRILSWSAFVPLGRLTYMAYLLHPIVQSGYSGTIRERMIYSHYSWVNLFLGFLTMSYGFAVLATLCFETPFLGLEKVLLGVTHRKKKSQAHVNGAYDPGVREIEIPSK